MPHCGQMKAKYWGPSPFQHHSSQHWFHQGPKQAKCCICANYLVKPKIQPVRMQEAIQMNRQIRQKNILVVDDELAIVKIIEKFLEKLGYRVISTDSAINALQLFKQYEDQIFLVITDLTMPDLCGTDLTKKIRAVRPEIPIILCTGYGEMIGQKRTKGLKITAYLGKPITRDELASVIDRVIAQG